MVVFECMVKFIAITGKASSSSLYQMLICSDLDRPCSECIAQCDETSYGGVCVHESPKSDRMLCCCKKSPPPSYYDPPGAPSS